MCVCIPPATAPFLLPLLEWLAGALWALAPMLVAATTVLLAVLYLAGRGLVALVAWPVRALLERRSDRLWNERVAAIHRAEPSTSRHRVHVTVVRPEPAEVEAASPPAIEARRRLPGAVRMYATPRRALDR